MLSCGHLLCKKHTPAETALNEGRKARCGVCGVDEEIKQWSLTCGCVVSKLDGFEVFATREGSRISLLRVRCQKKHEMLVSNIKWVSSRYAYNAILSYLSEVLKDDSITTLDFNCDKVGDEGAEAIANSLMYLHYKFITLNLWSNDISDKGAKAIAELLKNDNYKLASLNLRINQIGYEEARAMSMTLRNENWRLTIIELGNNDLSEELLKSIYRILEEKKAILSRIQLAETAVKSEERKRLAEAQQKNVDLAELLKSNLEMCDASIRESNEKKTVIDKQQNLHKKSDMITQLDESLKKVEEDFKLASEKIVEQIGKKAAEVREFRRILSAKGEEVNKRIAEEDEEKKKPLSAAKGECAHNHIV